MTSQRRDRRGSAETSAEWTDELSAAVAVVARRRRLSAEQRDDLLSYAVCRLLERNVGRGDITSIADCPGAYLRRVVDRLWIDLTNELWGRWRPSAGARRMGKTGVELDRLIRREGLAACEAVPIAEHRSSRRRGRDTLYRLARKLRPKPRRVSITAVDPASDDRPDRRLGRKEEGESLRRALRMLREEMERLDDLSRRVLSGKYLEQLTAGRLGRELDLDDRSVYRIAYRALGILRQRLQARGVDPGIVEHVG